MTSDSSIYSGPIASIFSQVLATEELLAATKKAPAKKVPVKTPATVSIPKGKVTGCQTGAKKKASNSSSEVRGWTLLSQPHI